VYLFSPYQVLSVLYLYKKLFQILGSCMIKYYGNWKWWNAKERQKREKLAEWYKVAVYIMMDRVKTLVPSFTYLICQRFSSS
jgi:hypothetical protein